MSDNKILVSIETRNPEDNTIVSLATESLAEDMPTTISELKTTAEAFGLQVLKHNNRYYGASATNTNNNVSQNTGNGKQTPDNLKEVKIQTFVRQIKINEDGSETFVLNCFAPFTVYEKHGEKKTYGNFREFPMFFDNPYGYSSPEEMYEAFFRVVGKTLDEFPLHAEYYSDSIPKRTVRGTEVLQREWEITLSEPITVLVWHNEVYDEKQAKTNVKKNFSRFGGYVDNGYEPPVRTR